MCLGLWISSCSRLILIYFLRRTGNQLPSHSWVAQVVNSVEGLNPVGLGGKAVGRSAVVIEPFLAEAETGNEMFSYGGARARAGKKPHRDLCPWELVFQPEEKRSKRTTETTHTAARVKSSEPHGMPRTLQPWINGSSAISARDLGGDTVPLPGDPSSADATGDLAFAGCSSWPWLSIERLKNTRCPRNRVLRTIQGTAASPKPQAAATRGPRGSRPSPTTTRRRS
ncbi:uncharacterized protein LOC112478489 [Pteropus alecto]|uniref:uncharacterized protein LOC112478489 n=1 Tax=Pteropus alecto TaxID=9402 RepID=UPI000D53257B|nr:uncharacterized protein LOC112478489 [Pteropus alecto]